MSRSPTPPVGWKRGIRESVLTGSILSVFYLLSILLIFFSPTVAWAHGGVAIDMDPCVQRAGAYLVHFSAYQPQVNAIEEFCSSVPQTGNVILVFDLIYPEPVSYTHLTLPTISSV